MAVHLLKWIHFVNEQGLGELSFHYIRDKEKHEVDFLVCKNKKPWIAIECKKNADSNPTGIYYFSDRLNIPHSFVLSLEPIPTVRKTQDTREIIRMSASEFLSHLI